MFDIKTWEPHYHESASSCKSCWKNYRYKPGCTRHSQSFSCVLWSWRTLTEPGRKTPAETCKTDRTVVNHTNDLMECWELLSHEISKFMNKLQLSWQVSFLKVIHWPFVLDKAVDTYSDTHLIGIGPFWAYLWLCDLWGKILAWERQESLESSWHSVVKLRDKSQKRVREREWSEMRLK